MKKIKYKIVLLILICIGITMAIQGSYSIYQLNVMADDNINRYRET